MYLIESLRIENWKFTKYEWSARLNHSLFSCFWIFLWNFTCFGRVGRWLSDLVTRFCLCLQRSLWCLPFAAFSLSNHQNYFYASYKTKKFISALIFYFFTILLSKNQILCASSKIACTLISTHCLLLFLKYFKAVFESRIW